MSALQDLRPHFAAMSRPGPAKSAQPTFAGSV